jgi:S1-C subfamily serine protease
VGIASASLALVLFAGQVWAQESLPTLIKQIQPSVVTIIAYDAQGKVLRQGSGFFIAEHDRIITNHHVLEGASHAEVKAREGKGYVVTHVVAEDKDGDLLKVGIQLPDPPMQGLRITRILPEVGERVVVVGSPLGLEQTVTDGIVSAVRDIPRFGKILQITAPISSGSSGSPVVNLRGEVIGVATVQMREGQNLNCAIPGSRVLALKSQKGRTLVEWATGVTQEAVAQAEALLARALAIRVYHDLNHRSP